MSKLSAIGTQARRVRAQRGALAAQRGKLYSLIREAWPEHALWEIAEAAGLSVARIQQITKGEGR